MSEWLTDWPMSGIELPGQLKILFQIQSCLENYYRTYCLRMFSQNYWAFLEDHKMVQTFLVYSECPSIFRWKRYLSEVSLDTLFHWFWCKNPSKCLLPHNVAASSGCMKFASYWQGFPDILWEAKCQHQWSPSILLQKSIRWHISISISISKMSTSVISQYFASEEH